MNFRIIKTIAKKEFFNYLNSALAYTVVVPFLLLSLFIYSRTVFVSGQASLRPYFELLPWFLLVLAPALTMKLVTEEKKEGTLEVLFAHPLSEGEIILGKFFGVLLFYLAILGSTFILPLVLIIYSQPDLGQILGQYLGGLLIGASFMSAGLFASCMVESVIGSFLLGAAISFGLLILGFDFLVQFLPFPFNKIAVELAILNHTENVARGLLDIRDIFYFLTLSGVFLIGGIIKLAERKIAEDKKEKRNLYLIFGLTLAIGVISNVFLSYYPLRLDITQGRIFTLSKGTKQTLKNLPDVVNITVYQSPQLPAQMQLIAKDIGDLLKDYQKLSKNLKVNFVYPTNKETIEEAQTAGIEEVQFNTFSVEKFEVQAGFLGMVIRYGEKKEVIPFIGDTTDLEYQLTRRIRKITKEKEEKIGLIQTGFSQNQLFQKLLASQYQISNLSSSQEANDQELTGLIIVDSGIKESTPAANLKKWWEKGKGVLVLTSGVVVDAQSMLAQKSESEIIKELENYGIKVNQDLVYDWQLGETLIFGTRGRSYLARYPYWLRALPTEESLPFLQTIKSVTLAWPSSLTLEGKEGISYKKILVSGKNAGRKENSFEISPEAVKDLKPNVGEVLLGVLAEKGESRLLVVGSPYLIEDRFLENNPDNGAFLANIVDYLVADKQLLAIPRKSMGKGVFRFSSASEAIVIQYGSILVSPILTTFFAAYYLQRRKKLTQRKYEE